MWTTKSFQIYKDTQKEHSLIPFRYTVAIQCKENGPWVNDTVITHLDANYNGRSYKYSSPRQAG